MVLAESAANSVAVLAPPRLLERARSAMAVFCAPVLFSLSASAPTAVLESSQDVIETFDNQVALQRSGTNFSRFERKLWHELVLLLPYRRLKVLIEMVNLD